MPSNRSGESLNIFLENSLAQSPVQAGVAHDLNPEVEPLQNDSEPTYTTVKAL
jgi:hypothetical protein